MKNIKLWIIVWVSWPQWSAAGCCLHLWSPGWCQPGPAGAGEPWEESPRCFGCHADSPVPIWLENSFITKWKTWQFVFHISVTQVELLSRGDDAFYSHSIKNWEEEEEYLNMVKEGYDYDSESRKNSRQVLRVDDESYVTDLIYLLNRRIYESIWSNLRWKQSPCINECRNAATGNYSKNHILTICLNWISTISGQ